MTSNKSLFSASMVALTGSLAMLLSLASFTAHAQYQWVDANGRKVFSDQPPPASVPAGKVVQQPGKNTASSSPNAAPKNMPEDAAAAGSAGKAGNATNSEAKSAEKVEASGKDKDKDKELEAKKKLADDAEAAKKKAEEEKAAKAKAAAQADNCARAQSAKAGLDSGVRIAVTNAKGERVVMDEAARMVETKRIQGIIQSDCK